MNKYFLQDIWLSKGRRWIIDGRNFTTYSFVYG